MTHLQTTRNPMSEARRQHIHGPIVSLIVERGPRYIVTRLAVGVLFLFVVALFAAAVS